MIRMVVENALILSILEDSDACDLWALLLETTLRFWEQVDGEAILKWSSKGGTAPL